MENLRTFDILTRSLKQHPKDDALAVKRLGKWEKFSTDSYLEFVNNFSYGLLELGFKKGDKIITISNNRPEWNFVDMGMSQVGVIHVPIYPNQDLVEYAHIFRHSDARCLIVSSVEQYTKILPIAKEVKEIEKVYTFNQVDGATNWMTIIELGKKNAEKYKTKLEEIKKSISPEDLVSIIYTSGTTGLSKGVMLVHRNFMSNVRDTIDLLPLDAGDKYLSFLPLCHVLERMVNYLVQYRGCCIYYAESIDTVGENMREVSPEGFAVVPRVMEKLYDKIIVNGKALTGIKKGLFFWALNLGLKYELNKANGWWYEWQLGIANKLIFSKWRAALGGKVKVIVSGGAALQERLARVFNAAKIPVLEGYGLTETSPVISVNQVHYPYMKFGTTGPVIKNVDVKIAEDGEILVKGPNLMIGYYKDKEKTEEVIDSEGWFHTGDIGELHEHRILKITDRKKEIFKLSTGKYVAPQVVENIFKESPFIDQIIVVGEGEKYASAVISPDFNYLHGWVEHHKDITYTNNTDLTRNKRVIERFQEEVDRINEHLGSHNQVKRFELTSQKWTSETGELSPTLKLKRRFLKHKYQVKLDKLYGYTNKTGLIEED